MAAVFSIIPRNVFIRENNLKIFVCYRYLAEIEWILNIKYFVVSGTDADLNSDWDENVNNSNANYV